MSEAVGVGTRRGSASGGPRTRLKPVPRPTDEEAMGIRQHLARELHDRVAQNLSAALINLELFRSQHMGRAGVLTEFSELERLTREALANLREIVYDLRGQTTDSGDFATLLRTGLIDPFAARTGIEVRMAVAPDWPAEVPPAVALDLYRIVQEALQNTQKHADAHLVEVNLELSADGNALSITVADD